MDTLPDGGIVTDSQKETVSTLNPERGVAKVNAIFSTFNQAFPNSSALGAERHNDIGYPTVMLCLDSNTEDVISDNNGYNWTGYDLTFEDRENTSLEGQMVWNDLYSIVFAANNVVGSIDEKTEDANEQFYLGQGLAARAFSYWVMAQLYQFNYKGNEDKPCVPLITEKNSADASVNGCKRSSVKDVYTQIESDLNNAIDLLTNAEKGKVKRADKRYISLSVAYGLRARMYLSMHEYAKAADDAANAIKAATSEGIAIASRTAVGKPTFWSVDEVNWMWGIIVSETDDVVDTGICNWPSHMGSLSYGYANYSGGRQISLELYNGINDSDIRKSWWLDAAAEAQEDFLTEEQAAFVAKQGYKPYTQVKFGPYNDVVGTTINANDIVLMRIEEMYLIAAEAYAEAGNRAEGEKYFKELLNNRLSSGSQAYLTDYASNPQEAVYFQRRIELWGEGVIWFDVMRLNKGVDRRGAGFPNAECVFNIAKTDDILLWRIPEAELQANKALTAEDSPAWTLPKPVADE
jgi:tetratricopeptide (TPR) repeat protein